MKYFLSFSQAVCVQLFFRSYSNIENKTDALIKQRCKHQQQDETETNKLHGKRKQRNEVMHLMKYPWKMQQAINRGFDENFYILLH